MNFTAFLVVLGAAITGLLLAKTDALPWRIVSANEWNQKLAIIEEQAHTIEQLSAPKQRQGEWMWNRKGTQLDKRAYDQNRNAAQGAILYNPHQTVRPINRTQQ